MTPCSRVDHAWGTSARDRRAHTSELSGCAGVGARREPRASAARVYALPRPPCPSTHAGNLRRSTVADHNRRLALPQSSRSPYGDYALGDDLRPP